MARLSLTNEFQICKCEIETDANFVDTVFNIEMYNEWHRAVSNEAWKILNEGKNQRANARNAELLDNTPVEMLLGKLKNSNKLRQRVFENYIKKKHPNISGILIAHRRSELFAPEFYDVQMIQIAVYDRKLVKNFEFVGNYDCGLFESAEGAANQNQLYQRIFIYLQSNSTKE